MPTPTITYTDWDGSSRHLPVGRDINVDRELDCLDICLERAVGVSCPLVVRILIRTNGDIVLWSTDWEAGNANSYWHFYAGEKPNRELTHAQRMTLERMWLGKQPMPGGLDSALGAPVSRRVFEGSTPDEVAARHGAPRPILNG